MRVAIMQPYFLPYIGYFQLIMAADVFVLYDDVSWIKQGWINRNRILLNGKEHMFTLEVFGASSNKLINKVNVGRNRKKLLGTFYHAYHTARFFDQRLSLINDILTDEETNLVHYIKKTLLKIFKHLELDKRIIVSSDIPKNAGLQSQKKIVSICHELDASIYINSIGGKELYSKTYFQDNGLQLKFLQPYSLPYYQNIPDFVPWLSIVDILMNADNKFLRHSLDAYKLQ